MCLEESQGIWPWIEEESRIATWYSKITSYKLKKGRYCQIKEIKQRRLAWISKELLTELRHKKVVYKKWKKRQVTQVKYRVAVWSCRGKFRKAKANLELNLARVVKSNKNGLYKCINSKRKTEENIGPLLNGTGDLVTKEVENTEVLNAFFDSAFTS